MSRSLVAWIVISGAVAAGGVAAAQIAVTDPTESERVTLPIPCGDPEIADQFGVDDDDDSSTDTDWFDHRFEGPEGEDLRHEIEGDAAEFGIDPGLLAANAFAEVGRPRGEPEPFLSGRPMMSDIAGLDGWGRAYPPSTYQGYGPRVRSEVPGAGSIRSTPTSEWLRNERGVVVAQKHAFPDGREALRAIAATLAWYQSRLQAQTPKYDSRPLAEQWALLRYAFNYGFQGAKRLAESGDPVLLDTGPAFPPGKHPQRAASVRAAQAMHMSRDFFDSADCDDWVPGTPSNAIDAGACFWWPYMGNPPWYWWCVVPDPKDPRGPIFWQRPCDWVDFSIIEAADSRPELDCGDTPPAGMPDIYPDGSPLPHP